MQAKRLRRHGGKTAASAVKHKLILRPSAVGFLLGDAMKAKEELGWQSTTSFQKLFKITAKKWWPLAKLERLVTSQKAAHIVTASACSMFQIFVTVCFNRVHSPPLLSRRMLRWVSPSFRQQQFNIHHVISL